MHAITQRPAAMYHSWGSQNAWLRQLHTSNCLYIPAPLAAAEGLVDNDWVWLESQHARIRVQVRVMQGVNSHTVWTWNAIGKRKGTWGLSPNAPESQQGFLLNHLIKDLLPAQENGYRYANADPITGQAAWYDLRVRLIKANAEEAPLSAPQFPTLSSLPGASTVEENTTTVSNYGETFAHKRQGRS